MHSMCAAEAHLHAIGLFYLCLLLFCLLLLVAGRACKQSACNEIEIACFSYPSILHATAFTNSAGGLTTLFVPSARSMTSKLGSSAAPHRRKTSLHTWTASPTTLGVGAGAGREHYEAVAVGAAVRLALI